MTWCPIHGFWNVEEWLEWPRNKTTLIENSMANWKTALTSNQEILGTVDIKRGIFQGYFTADIDVPFRGNLIS